MRSLSAPVLAEIATKNGIEPLIIVEIDWSDDVTPSLYCERVFDGIDGRIIQLGNFVSEIKIIGGAEIFSVSITIDDTDGVIKAIIDSNDIYKRPVKFYQAFGNLNLSDKFLLFDGQIASGVEWNESSHTLNFTITSVVENSELGFSPEEFAFENMSPDAVGKAWPLCFGSVLRVPAVKVTQKLTGKSLTKYSIITLDELATLEAAAVKYSQALYNKQAADQFFVNPGVRLNEESYNNIVNELGVSYSDLLHQQEKLYSQNRNQEENLQAFIDAVALKNKYIIYLAIIVDYLDTLENILTILYDGHIDATELGIQVENDKGSPYTSEFIINFLEERLNGLVTSRQSVTNLITTYSILFLSIATARNQQTILIENLRLLITVMDLAEIVVDSTEPFPQAVDPENPTEDDMVQLIVNNMKFEGYFDGNIYKIVEKGLPLDTDISVGQRLSSNPNEFWLQDSSYDLREKYCLIVSDNIYRIIYVKAQIGSRCFFDPVLWETGEAQEGGDEEDRMAFEYHLIDTGASIRETAITVLDRWLPFIDTTLPKFVIGFHDIPNIEWELKKGDLVIHESEYKDIYIANLITSSQIAEVMAFRSIDGEKVLVPVPSSYYTIDLEYEIAGQITTAIIFNRPLTSHVAEEWTEGVFVSLVSSQGPNTVDIIQWLIETYTDYDIDSTSFNSVSSSLAKYPSHFALLDRGNVMEVIENIAWQARCAIWVRDETVYIKYLAKDSSNVRTLTLSDVEQNSLSIQTAFYQQLVTKLTATWRKEYTEEVQSIVLRNNIPLYGLHESSFNFFIYNIEELVIKSATFWLIRYSNMWKYFVANLFINSIDLESLDMINIEAFNSYLGASNSRAEIETLDYDSASLKIKVKAWTGIKAGRNSEYIFAWPSDANSSADYPTADDDYAGGSQ